MIEMFVTYVSDRSEVFIDDEVVIRNPHCQLAAGFIHVRPRALDLWGFLFLFWF